MRMVDLDPDEDQAGSDRGGAGGPGEGGGADGHGDASDRGAGGVSGDVDDGRKQAGEHTSPRDVSGLVIQARVSQRRPSSVARRTAAARVLTSSLVKMCFVWVRSVLTDTNSRRAISGPVSSVASSRRTSSSRWAECVVRWGRGGPGTAEQRHRQPALLGLAEQRLHRCALVEEQPGVADRHGRLQGPGERGHGLVEVSPGPVGECTEHQDLGHAALPAASSRPRCGAGPAARVASST